MTYSLEQITSNYPIEFIFFVSNLFWDLKRQICHPSWPEIGCRKLVSSHLGCSHGKNTSGYLLSRFFIPSSLNSFYIEAQPTLGINWTLEPKMAMSRTSSGRLRTQNDVRTSWKGTQQKTLVALTEIHPAQKQYKHVHTLAPLAL